MFLLDALLNAPYIIVSARNALLPIPPRAIGSLPPVANAATPAPPPVQQQPVIQQTIPEKHEGLGTDSEPEHDEAGSEADVESNEGYGSGVGESWVSLKSKPSERNIGQKWTM